MAEKTSSVSLKKSVKEAFSVLSENVVEGGKADAPAYVVGYVTKRSRSKIPTGEDKKVLINKITYSVLLLDFRSTITVDYFNPPTIDKLDHEGVPVPDTEKLILVCKDVRHADDSEISVIPVIATRYGWGFAADNDRYAGEEF